MDIRKIKKLIELVQESDIAELEIKEGEESVRICRHSPVPMQGNAQTFLAPASSVAPAMPRPHMGSSDDDEDKNDESDAYQLSSPMVGTIYLTDKDTGRPLCSLGQAVTAGEVVCIIEAMTMCNHITVDKTGVISAILIEDGQQINFGQPILEIE